MGITFNGKQVKRAFFGGREVTDVSIGGTTICSKLPAPEGISIDTNTGETCWGWVEGADSYYYRINGEEFYTTDNCGVFLNVGDTIEVKAVGENAFDSDWTIPYTFATRYVYLEFTNVHSLPWNIRVDYPYDGSGQAFSVSYSHTDYTGTHQGFAFPEGSFVCIYFDTQPNVWSGSNLNEPSITPFSCYLFETDVWDNVNIDDISQYYATVIGITAGIYRTSSDMWSSNYNLDDRFWIDCDFEDSDGSTWADSIHVEMTYSTNQYGFSIPTPTTVYVLIPWGCSITINSLTRYDSEYGGQYSYMNWGYPSKYSDDSGCAVCEEGDAWSAWNTYPMTISGDFAVNAPYTEYITVFSWYSG